MKLRIEDLEFETTPVRKGLFSYRVRRGDGDWVQSREPIHGRASSADAKKAMLHSGRLDLQASTA